VQEGRIELTSLNTCGGVLFMNRGVLFVNRGVSLATNASLHKNHQINISREIRKKRTSYIQQPMQRTIVEVYRSQRRGQGTYNDLGKEQF
jgi:hypothetical protein